MRLLAGLSIIAHKDCGTDGDIARTHLQQVRDELAELRALKRNLQDFVDQCDAVCSGGPGRDCVVFEDLRRQPRIR